jgi:hypothetical protein
MEKAARFSFARAKDSEQAFQAKRSKLPPVHRNRSAARAHYVASHSDRLIEPGDIEQNLVQPIK